MSVDAYSGLPFQAGQAVATAVGRAAMAGISMYLRAPLRNTATIALVTLTAMAGSNALYSQTARHPAPLFGTFGHSAETAREVPQPLPIVGHEAAPAKRALPLVTNTTASEPAAAQVTTPVVTNDDVKAMQEKLTAFGFYSGKPDGLFGPKTSKSIRAFEEMTGRRQTGQLTPEIVALIKGAAAPTARTTTSTAVGSAGPATLAEVPVAKVATSAAEITASTATSAQPSETATLPPPAPLAVQKTTDSASAATSTVATVQPDAVVAKQPADASQTPATSTSAATNADVVKSVQRGLSSLGFLRTEITGVADEATARAIRNFEVYYNYAVSGRVTSELVNLLVQNGAVI